MLAATPGFRHRAPAAVGAPAARGRTPPDLRLLYFYDLPLPSRKAAPIQFLNTARAMAELGVRVVVLAGRLRSDDRDVLSCYGLEPHPGLVVRPFFPERRMPWRSRALRAGVAALLQDGRHGGRRTVLMSRGETGVELFRAVRSLGAPRPPFVYEAHRLGFERKAESQGRARSGPLHGLGVTLVRYRERAVVEGADGLVCLTAGVRDALAEHFDIGARPTLLLPSGTRCRSPGDLPPLDHPGRDIDVLYVGKLAARKGVGQLLEAQRHMPGVTVAVVGGSDGERDDLRRRAAEAGIPPARLLLPGWVPPVELRDWYRRARVGVCPLPAGESATAERYTSPMKVLEMMAEGVPVVASDVPAVRELLTDGSTSLLVPPNRPDRLAEAVLRLLEDRRLGERLRENALVEVQRYCWTERGRRLAEFLGSLFPE